MTVTTIYFFRHGKIDNPNKIYYGRHIQMKLSGEGQNDLKSFAELLKNRHVRIDMLFTSPLHRAVHTAQILASILGIDKRNIVPVPELTDVKIPSLAGKPLTLRAEIHNRGTDEYSEPYAAEGHETRDDIVKRMYSVVTMILREYSGKHIGIVSHGDSLRFLLYELLSGKKPVPPVGELKKIYYPQKGEGWYMKFAPDGNVIQSGILPNGEDLVIQY